jgi:hypothetical protein
MTTCAEPPFPCPFCHSTRVVLVGGGLVFLHYQCAACSEVWTAMAAAKPAVVKPSSSAPKLALEVSAKDKVWPN